MKLFPHSVVEDEKEDILVNIVDDETAICSICDDKIAFDQGEMVLIPDEYNGVEPNLYAKSNDISGKHYNIRINPKPKEEWVSQNQDADKERISSAISNLAKLFKTIGGAAYSEFIEKQYVIRPTFDHNEVALRSGTILNLSDSLVTVETDGPIDMPSKIKSWIANYETDPVDCTADILTVPGYLFGHLFHGLNSAISKEFTSRFVFAFETLDGMAAIDSVLSDLALSGPSIGASMIRFINLIKNAVVNYNCSNIFKPRLTQTFLTAADNLEIVAREILKPYNKIVTRRDFSSTEHMAVKEEYFLPICESCADDLVKKCHDCREYKYKAEMHYIAEELICDSCGDDYFTCDGCGVMIHNEDSWYEERTSSTYCESCYDKNKSEKIDTSDFSEPENLAGNRLFFLSGNKQTLQKLIAGLKTLQSKTRGGAPDKLYQDVLNTFKANGFKEDEAIVMIDTIGNAANVELMGNPVGAEDFKWYLSNYISAVQNYITEQDNFYTKYPLAIDDKTNTQNIFSGKKLDLLKNYQPMSVTYEYDEANRGESNFVIKMMPGKTMLEQAETLFPGFGKNAWKYFSNTGTQHHPGCIAYARIASYDDYFVIDNLQRDSDINNAKPDAYVSRFEKEEDKVTAEKALRWWDKRTSKWYVQFAAYLVSFAEHNDKKLYLTNFDTQKKKWKGIPEKNREVYDSLPEEMASAGFYRKLKELRDSEPDLTAEELKDRIDSGKVSVMPMRQESFDGNVEDLSRAVGGIWRLAHRYKILGLFKKASR